MKKIHENDFFEIDFPFWSETDWEGETLWIVGCRAIDDGHPSIGGNGLEYFANGIGKKRFEVIKIVEMPSKYQDRVVFAVQYVEPSGFVKRRRILTETVGRFNTLLKGFPCDFENAEDES